MLPDLLEEKLSSFSPLFLNTPVGMSRRGFIPHPSARAGSSTQNVRTGGRSPAQELRPSVEGEAQQHWTTNWKPWVPVSALTFSVSVSWDEWLNFAKIQLLLTDPLELS